jgi:hypothetical protein
MRVSSLLRRGCGGRDRLYVIATISMESAYEWMPALKLSAVETSDTRRHSRSACDDLVWTPAEICLDDLPLLPGQSRESRRTIGAGRKVHLWIPKTASAQNMQFQKKPTIGQKQREAADELGLLRRSRIPKSPRPRDGEKFRAGRDHWMAKRDVYGAIALASALSMSWSRTAFPDPCFSRRR